ncbi:MAG: VWA domain-containing protein, partial [Chloroflexi bacterium]|nr:VWA domain-containing protein [Chloroflexota bacterium]
MRDNHSGYLLNNIVLFGRLLREVGLDINPSLMITLIEALNHIEINKKIDFYHTSRGILVHRYEDLAVFDQAFEMFWRMGRAREAEGQLLEVYKKGPKPVVVPPALEKETSESGNDDENDPVEVLERHLAYSPQEILRHKDFADMTAEEVEAVKGLMKELVWQLGERRTRRMESGSRSPYDLRRTYRGNIRYGGEVLEWAKQQPKKKRRALIVIADVSGSMEKYSRLLLQFIYGLAKGLDQRVEVFIFSTRLTRITRQLKNSSVERAMKAVAASVQDWSGGTRIGDALKTFNFDWGRRVLGGGAVVLFISDGWDRGDPDLLKDEMARLQRTCHRLIWLNPLLGGENYEPLTQGAQATIGHIDDFLPIHNLDSLENL